MGIGLLATSRRRHSKSDRINFTVAESSFAVNRYVRKFVRNLTFSWGRNPALV
jgi:hypothetical protein